MLRVDSASGAVVPTSPSNSFLTDEVASTCPLLTPSPPTNALVNPLPETEETDFLSVDELASKLQQVHQDGGQRAGTDSPSSSSSALAEPSCTQLLNHYHHIEKDENSASQDTGGKTQPLQMTFRNPPENYFFMKWNWPLIRKVSIWLFLSTLAAMLALVIGMITTLPKTCNPETRWFQGKTVYEIFPASFFDSDGDGIGDIKGITYKVGYLRHLGVDIVRLNSIYPSIDYPENYYNVTSLLEMAPQLGDIKDFEILSNTLRSKNMSLVLDFPLLSAAKSQNAASATWSNETNPKGSSLKEIHIKEDDPVLHSLLFWSGKGVDGFYLKNLDLLFDNPHLPFLLKLWRKIIGPDRVFIVDQETVDKSPREVLEPLLETVDLVEIRLQIEGGVERIKRQLDAVVNGTLFSGEHMPWVMWSLGDFNSTRLANRLPYGNATLGATLLQLMLPGTPCIFYGDEIGLRQIADPHDDRRDVQHLHQLGAMAWNATRRQFTHKSLLPWMHGQQQPVNFDQLGPIAKTIALRDNSPSIYVNAIHKENDYKANAEVKYAENDLLVIQRWYPRRKSYVVVSNLGYGHISADLSTLLYSGDVVVGPGIGSTPESITFKHVSLWPGESVIVLLD